MNKKRPCNYEGGAENAFMVSWLFLYFRHTLGQLQRPLLTIPHIGCQSLIKLRFMTD